MRFGIHASAIVLALGVATPTPGLALSLTLDEAQARAEAASPLVRSARAERQVVSSRRVGAAIRLPSNPIVSGSAGMLRIGPTPQEGAPPIPGAVGAAWALHLEQAVEIGGQRGARLNQVARAKQAAIAREQFALVETHARVRAAYIAALMATELVEAERVREALATQIVASVEARVRVGAASDVDLALAEAERGRGVAARVDAERERDARLVELRTLVGVAQMEPLTLATPLGAPMGEVPGLDPLLSTALARRADLLALRRDAGEVDAAIVRLRRERIPNPAFFADLQMQPELGGQSSFMYLAGGVAIALPIFRRNQGELAIAHAERQQLDIEADIAERVIAEEVAQARQEVIRRREQLALYENTILPSAIRQATLLREGWRAGKFDLFRVMGAVRDEAAARRERLGAFGALWQAAITLDRATGVTR